MGLRFRKSIKIAPGVRINFNKKSTSMTFGKRGLHYTVSSTGKKTASIGIPNTGISYTTSTNKRTTKKNTAYFQKTISNKISIMIILIIILLIALLAIVNRTSTKENAISDMQILKAENHPKFYDEFNVAKEFWAEYPNVAVVNAKQTIYNEDAILLITTGDSDRGVITSIKINFANSTKNNNYTLDDMLALTCEYIPFNLIDQYYIFADSFKEITSDNSLESFYYIYDLNNTEVALNNKNNINLKNKFAFNIFHHLSDNSWIININYLASKGNTEKWKPGYYSKENWFVDLNLYK